MPYDWKKIYPNSTPAQIKALEKKYDGYGEPVNVDDSSANADWTKQSWDLPPFGSTEFYQVVPLDQLEEFKKSAVYKNAVEKGWIYDDEWTGLMEAGHNV